jgi:acyl-CoA synthetase (NDP forming)
VISLGGGARALIIDRLAAEGIDAPGLDPGTAVRLRAQLGDLAVHDNPIDAGAEVLRDGSALTRLADTVASVRNIDSLIVQFPSWDEPAIVRYTRDHLADLGRLSRSAGKPIILGTLAQDLSPATRSSFYTAGLPIMRDPSDAVKAATWLSRSWAYLNRLQALGESIGGGDPPHQPVPGNPDWKSMARFVEAIGIPVARGQTAGSAEVAEELLHGAKYPVAMKFLAPSVLHKTEAGHVHLGVPTFQDARQIIETAIWPDASELLVQEMLGGVEVLLSAVIDHDLGPVVSVAPGGVRVDLLTDAFAYLTCPFSRTEAARALDRAGLTRLLNGYRGAPEADTDALIGAMVRLGEYASRLRRPGACIELNPVLVQARGHGIRAVDIVVTGLDRPAD